MYILAAIPLLWSLLSPCDMARSGAQCGSLHRTGQEASFDLRPLVQQADLVAYNFLRERQLENKMRTIVNDRGLLNSSCLYYELEAAIVPSLKRILSPHRVPHLCRKLDDLWKWTGALQFIHAEITKAISDVDDLLSRAIDDQLKQFYQAGRNGFVRPSNAPTKLELDAITRLGRALERLHDQATIQLTSAVEILEQGYTVTYAKSLVDSFVITVGELEKKHGTEDCKQWMTHFFWWGPVISEDIAKEKSKFSFFSDDFGFQDSLLRKVLYACGYGCTYWRILWRVTTGTSRIPSTVVPDSETSRYQLAIALVAERLLEAFRKMKGSIFDPITDLENSVNRALLRIDAQILSSLIDVHENSSVSRNVTTMTTVPCIAPWVDEILKATSRANVPSRYDGTSVDIYINYLDWIMRVAVILALAAIIASCVSFVVFPGSRQNIIGLVIFFIWNWNFSTISIGDFLLWW